MEHIAAANMFSPAQSLEASFQQAAAAKGGQAVKVQRNKMHVSCLVSTRITFGIRIFHRSK
jgi:hypothetical protein